MSAWRKEIAKAWIEEERQPQTKPRRRTIAVLNSIVQTFQNEQNAILEGRPSSLGLTLTEIGDALDSLSKGMPNPVEYRKQLKKDYERITGGYWI